MRKNLKKLKKTNNNFLLKKSFKPLKGEINPPSRITCLYDFI